MTAINLLSPCSTGEVLVANTERLDFVLFVVLTNAFAKSFDLNRPSSLSSAFMSENLVSSRIRSASDH